MDLSKWFEEMTKRIAEVRSLDLGYPLGVNEFVRPQVSEIVKERIAACGLDQIPNLVEFYSNCDGLRLPDIHVGYFVVGVDKLDYISPESQPTQISGGHLDGRVSILGWNGGGELFALRHDKWDMLILHHGPLHGGIYDGNAGKVELISAHFTGFLERLLSDVNGFVNETPGHRYMS